MNTYLLENAWAQQRERLAGLERWFDPGTIRHFETLGVAPGWRCLEVGAGGGSITRWLCERVGSEGLVHALDIDTRFVAQLSFPQLTVQQANIITDPLPVATYDLAHARFVIEHLVERHKALLQMANALKPGGWLIIEDTDSASWVASPSNTPEQITLFTKWTIAYLHLCTLNGTDGYAGRRLEGEMKHLGMERIGAEGRVFMVSGGSAPAEVWRLTALQVSQKIIEAQLVTEEEMADIISLLANPQFSWMEGLVMAVWAQKPLTA